MVAFNRNPWPQSPESAKLIRRVGSDDMSRVTEQHLLEWRDALLKSVPSGKTHAVDTLVAALRRPTFRLDLGEVGSPFIHQTAVAMRQAFEQAKRSAPSLLVLEEIDAVASARGPMSQDHKVEELTEILRMIEAAAKNGVLVLATTNRKEALDPAVLRTGRFDHSVLVDYPTAEEVELAMEGMLKERPHDLLDLSETSRALAGRPMSDAAWVVNEAARLTARAKQDRISVDALRQALKRLRAGPSTGVNAS
ncbi:SpoVK/Ycf46/Vps4 family AAA+-type ATPase [Bradyrhizobium sp. AZCC 1693]